MRQIGLALAILLLASAASAQWAYLRFYQLTVDNTSGGVSFPSSVVNPSGGTQAARVTCTLEDAAIRYTVDGTTPTTTVGMPWSVGETLTIQGNAAVGNLKAIRTTSTDGVLSCTFSAP